jgi:hypothetical protein
MNSVNFAFTEFSEVRIDPFLGSATKYLEGLIRNACRNGWQTSPR